jgi:hypothetical protein
LRRACSAPIACNRPATVATMVRTSWSSMANSSWARQSKRSAQSWLPLSASISCAVMRMRSPRRRTLPVTT